uniref:Superoxide dismutase copper/zinc binding domain-containing protein n=1 Tax=Xenopus tropicalis TaxID=8364 RepID=A0A6I8QKX2_XENTR
MRTKLIDWNLPLYGNNSVVGRSVVLSKANGTEWVCSTIRQEGDMVVATASFHKGVVGHFNPFGVNVSTSPPAGNGTDDEYEVGDISGRRGLLVGKDSLVKQFIDMNFPLSGTHSILGRSLVIHYTNGSREERSAGGALARVRSGPLGPTRSGAYRDFSRCPGGPVRPCLHALIMV